MNNLNVKDAIEQAKAIRPSEVSDHTMLSWLQALDGQIWTEVVSQYENPYPAQMPTYDESDIGEDVDRELLVSSPYDDMYVVFLVMRIDLYNADYERYNNEAVQFNEIWQRYVNWYNRSHVHKSRVDKPEEGQHRTWLQF